MKKILITLLVIFNININAQTIQLPMFEKALLEGGTSLPSIEVSDLFSGESFNLSKLSSQKYNFKDKPTLILTWSETYCKPCIGRINALLKEGIDKEFNIFTINIDTTSSISNEGLKNIIKSRDQWGRLNHFKTNPYFYASAFQSTNVPHWIILNKNFQIIDEYRTLYAPMNELKEELNYFSSPIDYNKKIPTNTIFNSSEQSITKLKLTTVQLANTFFKIENNNQLATIKLYDKNDVLLKSSSFKKINKEWLYNGTMKEFYQSGKIKSEIPYLDGKLTGIVKLYDITGDLAKEVSYINNELEGFEKYYFNAVQIIENTYQKNELVDKKIFNDNISSQIDILIGKINNSLNAPKYFFTKEGINFLDGSDQFKTLKRIRWKDISSCEVKSEEILIKGSTSEYSIKKQKEVQNIEFKDENFYFVTSDSWGEFKIQVKNSNDINRQIQNMIYSIKYLKEVK